MASAPLSSEILAKSGIDPTFGESFTISGFFVTFLTLLITSFALSGSVPKAMPPSLTLGQDIFSSIIGTSVSSRISAPSTYSSTECPPRFAMATVSCSNKYGSSISTKYSMPGFCRPIEFIIPAGVS